MEIIELSYQSPVKKNRFFVNPMNKKFLEEAQQLEARWAKSGLLDKLMPQDRVTVAVLLEGQRLMNEPMMDNK